MASFFSITRSCDTILCIAIHFPLSARIFSLTNLAIKAVMLRYTSLFHVGSFLVIQCFVLRSSPLFAAPQSSCDTKAHIETHFLLLFRLFSSCDTLSSLTIPLSSSIKFVSQHLSAFSSKNACDTLPFIAIHSVVLQLLIFADFISFANNSCKTQVGLIFHKSA